MRHDHAIHHTHSQREHDLSATKSATKLRHYLATLGGEHATFASIVALSSLAWGGDTRPSASDPAHTAPMPTTRRTGTYTHTHTYRYTRTHAHGYDDTLVLYCPSGSLRRQSLADDPDGCRQARKRWPGDRRIMINSAGAGGSEGSQWLPGRYKETSHPRLLAKPVRGRAGCAHR